jgi:hypothetical protein
MSNNLFNTNQYLFDNYFFKNGKYSNEELMKYAQLGVKKINKSYSKMLQKINDELKKPIVMAPPFYWVQSLRGIEFEIKYAYRHDVAGCADLFNQTVRITKDIFYIGISCKELDQTMFFELHFKFWDEVDPETIKIERRPVGKLYVSV